jgi:methionyl-tRNA formyltransferase
MGEERKAKSEEREVQRGLRPGAILRANAARGELFVSTASGAIAIDELQAEGRKRMGTTDFLRGYDIVHEEILS